MSPASRPEPPLLLCDREIPRAVQLMARDHGLSFRAGLLTGAASAEGLIASGSLRVTEDLMKGLRGLAVVSRTGVGHDRIDLPAATRLGIGVCIAVDGPTVSTAEHAIALALAVSKRLLSMSEALRQGARDRFNDSDSMELNDQTLGVVGFGRIGKRVARLAQGMGMRVVAHDPYEPPQSFIDLGVPRVSLAQLLEVSCVVSLHLPLTSQTHGLIGDAALGRMRRGSILINTSRAEVVDQPALLEAVASGHLAGAGLDVIDHDDPSTERLLAHPHVLATPHVAAATTAGIERLWLLAISQALAVLQGGQPDGLLNPEARRQR